MDMHLSFPARDIAMNALREAFSGKLLGDIDGTLGADWSWPKGTAVSMIGPIVVQPAEVDDDGNTVTAAIMEDNFHLIIATDDTAAAAALSLHASPAGSYRVFAR